MGSSLKKAWKIQRFRSHLRRAFRPALLKSGFHRASRLARAHTSPAAVAERWNCLCMAWRIANLSSGVAAPWGMFTCRSSHATASRRRRSKPRWPLGAGPFCCADGVAAASRTAARASASAAAAASTARSAAARRSGGGAAVICSPPGAAPPSPRERRRRQSPSHRRRPRHRQFPAVAGFRQRQSSAQRIVVRRSGCQSVAARP